MIEGHIYTDGEIKRDYAKAIEEQLGSLAPNTEKIIHHMRSGGGNVQGGYEGYLALLKYGKPIKTIIEGGVASMATFVALAGSEIEMMDPGMFMIHEPFFNDGVRGDVDTLENARTELLQIRDTMANAYAKRTKLPLDQIQAMMKKETRMTPQQAKTMGFVDLVLEPHKVGAVAQAISDISKNFETFKEDLMKLFGNRTAVATGATAVDLPLKAGGAIHIESENGDLVQKPATIDGKPAEGAYDLGDGRTLVCAGGIVTEVKTAASPAMPAQETDAQKVARLETELQAIKAAEQAKVRAAEEATKVATLAKEVETAKQAAADKEKELATAQAKIKELESATVGDANKPNQAVAFSKYGIRDAKAADLEMTKSFLYQNGFEYLTTRPDSPMYNYRPDAVAASVLETNFSYTWPGILTDQIFYKPALTGFSLADFFTIDQGIKDRKRYNLVTQLDKILKPYGGCARVFNGNVRITDTLVQTKEFQVGLEWCKDDFTTQLAGTYNILASEWLKTGNRSFDPTGTPVMQVVDKLASEALARDVFRRVFFAAGNSSDDDYNQIDGFWDRAIDSSGNSNYCVIRANSTVFGGTGMGIGDLAANQAQTNLEAVYRRSAQILKNMPNKKMFVTRSVWENWFNTLTGVGAVTEQQFDNLVNGVTSLTYKGIPLVPVDLWDSFLAESDNPFTGVTRHLIVMTVKENHILGVENGADLNKLEGWYERKDRKFYMEGDMKFGYNYLHCDLTTIAY